MQEKHSDLLKLAKKIAKEAGKMLIKLESTAKLKVKKTHGDYALDADIKSENFIIKSIKKKYPRHCILTEECGSVSGTSEYCWVIDPLDGTLNYAHHIPTWGVNIGIMKNGEPIIGVFYAPKLNEFFEAEKGKGTKLNGKKVKVNKDTKIIDSFICGNVNELAKLNFSTNITRVLGSSALELCYIACGRFGARVKFSRHDPYGWVAGTIIVTEAGGKVTTPNGKKWTYDSLGAVASNGLLHSKIILAIKKAQ